MKSAVLVNALLLSIANNLSAFAFTSTTFTTSSTSNSIQKRSNSDVMTLMMARRGKGNLKKSIEGDSSTSNSSSSGKKGMMSSGTSTSNSSGKNWVKVQGVKSMADLPQEENQVKLIETGAITLKDANTNPNGAVGVVKYNGKTYCFSAQCSCCKIPMTKAKVLSPNEETNNEPRIECDFCKSTFNIKTGEVLSDASKPGFLGGMVKGVFSATEKTPITTYALGEKNGDIVIAL